MLFIDASVVVAILAGEDDAEALMARLEREEGPFGISPIVRMEATLSLARRIATARKRVTATPEDIETATTLVDQFTTDLELTEIAITAEIGRKALAAAGRYGKLVNHPAKLNLGDCLAYACAQELGARLAFKGNDFVETDLGW
ncbi:type II toxin-antitoxin system VapC family toxin [Nitratireductor basaltis]|uniref:Ribonuclease VapC n=1 Tax=Nitratireductor basaltis TaxID=472175 RepID=A0A084U5S1_9HYPH|nr:type II toxin-antitoxin system VapC family toxin [Nitratireductor basaltis]KFB08307.1 Ribonuclease VapC [Nitratireductor basaltis]